MRISHAKTKLMDCTQHGVDANAELWIVEGDSAARSVDLVRNDANQAVLPMQGKPLNVCKATAAKVASFVLFQQIYQALGMEGLPCLQTESANPAPRFNQSGETKLLRNATQADLFQSDAFPDRFQRVMLLFDPDADGIHCSALILLFFHRCLPQWIQAGRVHLVRAPMSVIQADNRSLVYAYSQAHQMALCQQLRSNGASTIQINPYRGLGSIDPRVLHELCIDPTTRRSKVVGDDDVGAALRIFGGK